MADDTMKPAIKKRYPLYRRVLDAIIVVLCDLAILAYGRPSGWRSYVVAIAGAYLTVEALRAPLMWAKWMAVADEAIAAARTCLEQRQAFNERLRGRLDHAREQIDRSFGTLACGPCACGEVGVMVGTIQTATGTHTLTCCTPKGFPA